MSGADLTAWYVGMGVGSAAVFAVVVAVIAMLQRTSAIGDQLVVVLEFLATVREDTEVVPSIRDLNSDVRQLNEAIASGTDLLGELPGGTK